MASFASLISSSATPCLKPLNLAPRKSLHRRSFWPKEDMGIMKLTENLNQRRMQWALNSGRYRQIGEGFTDDATGFSELRDIAISQDAAAAGDFGNNRLTFNGNQDKHGCGFYSDVGISVDVLGAHLQTVFDRNYIDRVINATIVSSLAVTGLIRLLTIDHNHWQGWTLYEIVRYAPKHNWIAYEEMVNRNPVLAKMFLSGVVYSLGDWIAQCGEGKEVFEFSRTRMLRSGFVGFCLHGSVSHCYYHMCERVFPFQDSWVVLVKVIFDQTIWSASWNCICYAVLGLLRLESPGTVLSALNATFWPLLTVCNASWKQWSFKHFLTYCVIPLEQRLLWFDCVKLSWIIVHSTHFPDRSESRNVEGMSGKKSDAI